MLKWPDRETVDAAARRWARQQAGAHPELIPKKITQDVRDPARAKQLEDPAQAIDMGMQEKAEELVSSGASRGC
ncbi:hypothetical protein [uncultured Thiohalocapsa sp.]|uniref:hypothetical protein n=1 Tax=uncultured Thiohalocapsa sp. TaxID=768990 RepID=UPI0025D52501|nr:hypothetical protein [uncultured Thiohalocapsa sp.]